MCFSTLPPLPTGWGLFSTGEALVLVRFSIIAVTFFVPGSTVPFVLDVFVVLGLLSGALESGLLISVVLSSWEGSTGTLVARDLDCTGGFAAAFLGEAVGGFTTVFPKIPVTKLPAGFGELTAGILNIFLVIATLGLKGIPGAPLNN